MVQEINPHTRMKIRVNSYDRQALYEVWGLKEYENEHFRIGPVDVVIDIGAHIGAFSVWAAQLAENGKVLAYEPNAMNYRLLVENKTLNYLTNLQTFNAAVSWQRGQAKLYLSDAHPMTHSFFEDKNAGFEIVPTISLEDIFEEHCLEKVDYLKIDAEGAEYEIILNAPTGILKRIDKIFIEYHDYLNHRYNYRDLRQYLLSNGFEVRTGASLFHRYVLKLGLIMAHRPAGVRAGAQPRA